VCTALPTAEGFDQAWVMWFRFGVLVASVLSLPRCMAKLQGPGLLRLFGDCDWTVALMAYSSKHQVFRAFRGLAVYGSQHQKGCQCVQGQGRGQRLPSLLRPVRSRGVPGVHFGVAAHCSITMVSCCLLCAVLGCCCAAGCQTCNRLQLYVSTPSIAGVWVLQAQLLGVCGLFCLRRTQDQQQQCCCQHAGHVIRRGALCRRCLVMSCAV